MSGLLTSAQLSQHRGLATEGLPDEAGSQEELGELGRSGRGLGRVHLIQETVDHTCEYRAVRLWQISLLYLPVHLHILNTHTQTKG